MAERIQLCSIYRNLLRTVGHSVRFQKQEVKNLRRSLRDDFDQIIEASPTLAEVEKRASQTILFHLSSHKGRPSREPNDERRQGQSSTFPLRQAIAARVMLNLSSFTYHHLSPNTVMQSKGRTAIGGGSDSKNMRQIRSKRDFKRRANERIRAKGNSEDIMPDEMEFGDMGSQMITSLLVPHRRQRGPVSGPPDSRQFTAKHWNGQRIDGNMKQTQHTLIQMQQSLEEKERKHDDLKQKANSSGKTHDKESAEEAFKDLRSQRKIFLIEKKKFDTMTELHTIRSNAAALLHSITQRAESSTGAFLGSARIGKLARSEWLPP